MEIAIVILIVGAAVATVSRWAWRTLRMFGRNAAPACSCAANPGAKNATACAGCPSAGSRSTGLKMHRPNM